MVEYTNHFGALTSSLLIYNFWFTVRCCRCPVVRPDNIIWWEFYYE